MGVATRAASAEAKYEDRRVTRRAAQELVDAGVRGVPVPTPKRAPEPLQLEAIRPRRKKKRAAPTADKQANGKRLKTTTKPGRAGAAKRLKKAGAAKPSTGKIGLAGVVGCAMVGSLDPGLLAKHPELARASLELDSRLVLIDPSTNTDKFYFLQIVANGDDKYFLWTRWGRTGSGGTGNLDEGSRDEVYELFAAKFKEKTGVEHERAASGAYAPLPGKYKWLAVAKTGASAKWEYYVDDFVDGKRTGWYPYTDDASEVVEVLYHDYVVAKNADMANRFVKSGHFTYAVDLSSSAGEYTQRNTATGKERKIRRNTAP